MGDVGNKGNLLVLLVPRLNPDLGAVLNLLGKDETGCPVKEGRFCHSEKMAITDRYWFDTFGYL